MIFLNITLNREYCINPFGMKSNYIDTVEEFNFIRILREKLSRSGLQSIILIQNMPLNEKTDFIKTTDKTNDMFLTFTLGETDSLHSGRVMWHPRSSHGDILGHIIAEQLTHSTRRITYNCGWWRENPRNRSYLNLLKHSPSASAVVFLASYNQPYLLTEEYLRYTANTTHHSILEYYKTK